MNMRVSILALMLFVTAPAAWAMEIDFTVVLKTLEGDEANDCTHVSIDGKCDKFTPLTLGRLAAGALSKPKQGTPIAEQVKDGILAQRIFQAKADLSADEISNIKNKLGETGFSTVIIARAVRILDPVTAPKE